jgi:hypothetical protein
MFPAEFEHNGEHHVEPIQPGTWYEKTRSSERRNPPVSGVIRPLREIWQRDGLIFDVEKAKRILIERPRLPAFIETSVFDDDAPTMSYLETIYAHREDEWPWVHLHVPCIVGRHKRTMILMDGNHRFAKARRLGCQHFLAFKLTRDEMAEVQLTHLPDWCFF